jgi:hypothetical protein
MNRPRASIAIAVILVGLLFVVDVYATYAVFTLQHPGANDFYPRWRGTQLYCQEGVDPYSDRATLAIQEGMYGRPARPDEDQVLFVYPFYTVFLLAPLAWLPYAWVQAIWIVVVEFSLIGGVMLSLSLAGWRLPSWLLGLSALWGVVFYHSTRTVMLGQFAGLVFLWTAGALWALRRERDLVAGVLLALTTVKPQMSVLLVPVLLVWGLCHRRWRFLGSFGAAMALLLGASFALLPGWLDQLIQQVMLYPSYTALGSPVWIIAHHYVPQLGTAFEIGVSAWLLLYLLIQWRHLPRVGPASGLFQWVIGLTLIVTNLAVLRTATTNFVVLYIPLLFGLKVVADRLSRGEWMLAAFYVLSAVGMWALFVAAYAGKEPPIMYLPFPIAMFLLFRWVKGIGLGMQQNGPA